MTTVSVSTGASKIQVSISQDIAESLKAYSDRHGISAEETANYIIQNFLVEDGSMDVEPDRTVILDDDLYDYLETEFKAGLDSVKSESDWISKEEMREFVSNLKSN
ncbi:MAG: hypothetical protein IJ856_04670 [Candidatus Methanomethylophilaceae archaeon]|nr:hypothetical protein [Candidatus Methanomethylophilaceae archaeon]